MTLRHHPRPQTLARYRAGELSPGAALGLAGHLDACDLCRAHAAGDEISEDVEEAAGPQPSLDDPVTRALARLPGARPEGWRWAGRGLRLAHVRGAAGLGERVYLIQGRPGARLAPHGHDGAEYVSVLQGRFSEGGEDFEAGDFCEHDGTDRTHRLRVTGHETCICLVVTEAPLLLRGASRLLQPWLGI